MKCKPSLTMTSAALLAAVLTTAGQAQQQPQRQSGAEAQSVTAELRVLAVKHADAHELAVLLGRLVGPVHFDADVRTNSLLLAGPPEAMDAAAALIAQLDVPLGQREQIMSDEVRTFALRYVPATGDLAARLHELFYQKDSFPELRIAFDESSNQLIARGSSGQLDALELLMQRMDVQPAREGGRSLSGEMLVRLVWLVGGMKAGGARPLPEDLGEVAAELTRIGMQDLQVAAQTVVRVGAGHPFESHFTARLDHLWMVRVQGRIRHQDQAGRMIELSLDGNREEAPGYELRTTITTTSGHFVVLGVSPIAELDSAFVVQINDL